ncbi:ABC transporter permease [Mucilaginibacter ginsenosidivorans]|uniref:FtsX-like permease family protein n=1 Tax=Mucilaginibacter ginsenosidivorans TaxID=398053 RepID=A0A5B8UR66_9SPHI|nr:ABC transporter permease [Mucilaginibacter ginsenosidivorans]QEC61195.1 FtsX-like permease family protein [Mucilaginibacter ginsenosidivorans]
MIKNYLKVAWRNLVKNKVHSFINIISLSVGMTVSMLIGLWIWSELSFDRYHKNYESIARVMQNQTTNGEISSLKAMPIPVAYQLRHLYASDFKYVILSSWTNPHLISFKDKNLSISGNFMEPDAPEMLTLKMLSGNRNGLKDPASILLSQSVAKAIFGNTNVADKVIKLDTSSLKIAGVYQDLPANTSLSNISFIAPWAIYARTPDVTQAESDWNQNSFQIFAQVATARDMASVSSKIKNIKFDNEDGDGKQFKPEIFLYPMSRWHLYSEFNNGVSAGGDIKYVWLFGIVGIFVMVLACINFMNLSTARSEKRAREVGIRKAMGSLQGQLILQFLSESLLTALLAFAVSLFLTQLVLPFFNNLAGKQISILWADPVFWLCGIGFAALSGLFAGSYPAFYLSSFKPVKVMKGVFRLGSMAGIPRKALVVAQFTFSVIMIIGTIVVFRQVQFVKNRPVGYNRAGLVMVRPYSETLHRHIGAFRNDLLQAGAIAEVAESGNQITRGSRTSGGFKWSGKDPNLSDQFATFAVTAQYGKTIGWQFKAGRDFSKGSVADQDGLVLNESAVKYMGLKNPVGQVIGWNDKNYTILGVTKDMVVESPYEPIKPTIFYPTTEAGIINLRINPKISTADALTAIEATYKKYAPGEPFDYKFVDEEYADKFNNEERIGKLASSFAGLAIFISCLGLFGMASFMAEQRTKEIGVRKVLGASAFTLWSLLSKDFILLVIISLAIATPVGYYFMHNWLQHYTYHTGLPWWLFAATAAGSITITLVTVSYQSIKAALANPVKSLRSE